VVAEMELIQTVLVNPLNN